MGRRRHADGAANRIINATIDYTRERQTFGQPLLDNQVVHFRLAELKTEVEALRALIYRAVETTSRART